MLMASNNPLDYWGYMSDAQRQQDVSSGTVSPQQAQSWYGGMFGGGGTTPSWLNNTPSSMGFSNGLPQDTLGGQTATGGISYTPPEFQSSDSSPWQNLGFAGLAGLLTGSGGVAGTVLAGLGASDQMGNISNTQQNYANTINSMMQQLPGQTQFKPYTVSTGIGSYGTDASGGVSGGLTGTSADLSRQALGATSGFINQAQQQNPMLMGQANLFGNAASAYGPSSFSRQNIGMYGPQSGVQGMGSYGTSFRPDTLSQFGFGSSQAQNLSNQAYGLGMQGLAQAGQAGQGISGLQGQVQEQAQGMLSGLGGSLADLESEVYNRIRAMQSPEEQRQQLALDEKLAAQGRLGISTAQFGGTPEQLALSKAQEEAKNSAALQAMQQAQSEQQQAYGQATGLAGLSGQLAGQASDLQTAAQGRAQQLANMGMSAEQINSQLQSEGLSRGIQAGTYNRQGVQMQEDLTNSAFNRALQSGQFGREGQALASQLASQQQERDLASMGFRNQQDLLAQQLRSGDIQNQLALAGGSQQALAQALGLQQGYAGLGQGMMQMGYTPYQQLREDFAMANLPAQLAASGRETGVGLLSQLGLGGLAEQTKLETLRNNLMNQMYQTAGGLFSGGSGNSAASGGGNLGIDPNSIVGKGLGWLGDQIFGDDSGSSDSSNNWINEYFTNSPAGTSASENLRRYFGG